MSGAFTEVDGNRQVLEKGPTQGISDVRSPG
jgi:hypothetical protein